MKVQPETPAERRLGWNLLGTALALGLGLRLWLAFTDDGIYRPDELYQSLEPAHWLVFGFGSLPWEYTQGARTWVLPGLIAPLMVPCALSDCPDARTYLLPIRLAFIALSVATGVAVFAVARAWGATALAGAAGAALYILAVPSIYLAPRALSECATALPVLLGLGRTLRQDATRRDLVLGASLIGFATLVRLPLTIFSIGLLGFLAYQRRWQAAITCGLTLAAWTLALGLLDLLTWGGWFHSAIAYVVYNSSAQARLMWSVSVTPITYYPQVALTSLSWLAVPLLGLATVGSVRAPGLAICALGFLLIHTLFEHKELRFVLPVLPLMAVLAGLGFHTLTRGLQDRHRLALGSGVLLLALLPLLNWRALTFADLGEFRRSLARQSAFDEGGSVNRLLLAAQAQLDLCGLKIEDRRFRTNGGYSHLHRRVPLYPNFGPPRRSGYFNYVIALNTHRGSGQVRAADGSYALIKLPSDGCVPDPNQGRPEEDNPLG